MIVKIVYSNGTERVIDGVGDYTVTRPASAPVEFDIVRGRRVAISIGREDTVYVETDTGKTLETYKGSETDGH